MPNFGPLELVIILVIVAMLFGVGKLPEVFGAVGKGVREFRTNASGDGQIEDKEAAEKEATSDQKTASAAGTVSEAEAVKTAETA